MPNGFHTHNFNGVTSITDNHDHRYSGITSRDPDTMGHTHIMEGFTTTDDLHIHAYRLRTGPAIYRNGDHYHGYQGSTAVAVTHFHGMNGYTTLE